MDEDFEQARKLVLEKWGRIKNKISKLHGEIDTSCGFCLYARSKIGNLDVSGCQLCQTDIKEICNKMMSDFSDIESQSHAKSEAIIKFAKEVKPRAD